ncbi:hypothetical protein L1D44_04735 [Shewanella sp. Isolate13]|uniref:hypothetical protein n=1 Tax=Shewanella sp. Isolate13 TaxID=2908531 RepID=UPI001EFE321F|nr:hypothetical protein [Shewanella sp. Isolate13]MCG9729150.1 hypothetical protein [Shewanella sp. Isolate13]
MEENMNLFGKIDLFFTRVVCWTIHKVVFVLFALLGLLALVSIPLTFLEYGEGFADLDITEIALIALSLLMLWRFVSRAISCGYDKWATTKLMFMVLTAGILFSFFVESFLLYYLLEAQGHITSAFYEKQAEWIAFFDASTLIILLYGLAPTKPIKEASITKKVDCDETASSEAVIKDDPWGAKEA